MSTWISTIYNRLNNIWRWVKLPYWTLIDFLYVIDVLKVQDIPIVVNNFNRLTYTRQLLQFLEQSGFTRIIILDNHSSYPPLLEYYQSCPWEIIRLNTNIGHLALWRSGLYHKLRWNYFVLTDPDVVPVENCPKGFMSYFRELLSCNYKLDKVGFGIKIDDLPDTFSLKNKVINYERAYWRVQPKTGLFQAPIDTTFALYRPLTSLKAGQAFTLKAWRTGPPYLIRHLPWYIDSGHLNEEELYYRSHSNVSSTLAQQMSGKLEIY
ncbi:MAG: glycosyltransferase family 2 protein [Bacteroidetes bacterium]|nr:glycosyltransferase family 2 protein [Bacteroidota bacterium]